MNLTYLANYVSKANKNLVNIYINKYHVMTNTELGIAINSYSAMGPFIIMMQCEKVRYRLHGKDNEQNTYPVILTRIKPL